MLISRAVTCPNSMHRAGSISIIVLLFSCLLCSCRQESREDELRPALRLTVLDSFAGGVSLKVEAVNASLCHILCLEEDQAAPDAQTIISQGLEVQPGKITVDGLKDRTSYVAYGVASTASGATGLVESVKFITTEGAAFLYDWERTRTELPAYSNMALCYGGSAHRDPFKWDKDRFATHVSWVDGKGVEHWLFDAFLAIEFVDTGHNMEYAGGYGRTSANQASWTRLLDYWFEEEYGFSALDAAVEDAILRLGAPPSKRKVVMTVPDPILHQNFKDASSPTKYWGFIDGVMPDFNKASERQSAMRWFIDETRRRWDNAGYKNLEFIGFYCVSEDLAVPGYGYSQDLKRWEDVYPAITKYVHSCNETMNWIPYYFAAGHQLWEEFGFDYAMMQPNYFWHSNYDMTKYMNEVTAYGMSMEFEFDDAVLEESAGYQDYRIRFNKYISMCKEMGLYRTRELSYYMGGNTLYKLAHSTSEKDREFYELVCQFINDSEH